jgi:signal transduction histidine kinase
MSASRFVHCDVSEAALVRLDHLLQVGRFMATFAHEVNNCLHVISGMAELAQEAEGLPPSVAHKLTRIIEQSTRASGSIRHVIAFARERSTATVRIDFGALVEDAVALRRYPLSRLSVEVAVDRQQGSPFEVLGSPRELEQLVLALLLNAEQSLAQVPTPRQLSIVLAGDEDGHEDMVSLRVSDNGTGIDAVIRESMFQPFVSGLAQSEQAGLGLTVARLIVERHGGHIASEPASGGGATFLVRLPKL